MKTFLTKRQPRDVLKVSGVKNLVEYSLDILTYID